MDVYCKSFAFLCLAFSTSPEGAKQYIEKKYKTVTNFQQVAAASHKKSSSEGRIDVMGMKGWYLFSSFFYFRIKISSLKSQGIFLRYCEAKKNL